MTSHDVVPYLDALRDHLARHAVPSPVAVTCTTWREPVSAHLYEVELGELASALLAWARTLDGPTVTARRFSDGLSVRLTVVGRMATGAPVHVWGAIRYDRTMFPDLPRGVEQDVEPATLHGWARREVAA